MIGELPTQIEIAGEMYSIRTDFRDIIKILCAFSDPELENEEKVYVCLFILYEDFESISKNDYEEAFQKAVSFIDQGSQENNRRSPRLMDWEQDENIMFPAINKVAGFEVRGSKYIHWWTFLGYYMEISEGMFSQILALRSKRAKGKKLEKWEREFWNSNKSICVLKPKLTKEEKLEIEQLNKLLG